MGFGTPSQRPPSLVRKRAQCESMYGTRSCMVRPFDGISCTSVSIRSVAVGRCSGSRSCVACDVSTAIRLTLLQTPRTTDRELGSETAPKSNQTEPTSVKQMVVVTLGNASRDEAKRSVPLGGIDHALERLPGQVAAEVVQEPLQDAVLGPGRAPRDVGAEAHTRVRVHPVPGREGLRVDGVEGGHGHAADG